MSFPTAYAEGVSNLKIEGNPVLYDVLTAQFDYDGDKSEITYKWFISDSADGEYSEITDTCIDEAGKIRLLQETDWGEKEFTIYNTSLSDPVTVTPIAAAGGGDGIQNKYIKVQVTDPQGVSYESEPVYIEESWGGKELKDGIVIEGARNTTDPNYVFSVGGQEFILLDTFENDDSGHYLVMAKDTYGVRQYFMTDQSQRPYEMAYWLNHTFKDNGIDGKKLPE